MKKKPSDLVARLSGNITRPGPTPPAEAAESTQSEAAPAPSQAPKPRPRARTAAPKAPAARKSRKAGQPVRYTIVLERDLHRALRRYALDRDADASEVVRALLLLLMEQPDLDRQVMERLSDGGDEPT